MPMCLDYFHHGHVNILNKAGKYGNIILGLVTDKGIASYKKNKPILAICRGFQLIADIHGIKLEKINNHVRKFHSLKIGKSKFIKDKTLKVNSYHNYCIKNLPKSFVKVSNTKDGSIEIAEHKSKKILCLMFHPERKMKSKKKILKSIKNFF